MNNISIASARRAETRYSQMPHNAGCRISEYKTADTRAIIAAKPQVIQSKIRRLRCFGFQSKSKLLKIGNTARKNMKPNKYSRDQSSNVKEPETTAMVEETPEPIIIQKYCRKDIGRPQKSLSRRTKGRLHSYSAGTMMTSKNPDQLKKHKGHDHHPPKPNQLIAHYHRHLHLSLQLIIAPPESKRTQLFSEPGAELGGEPIGYLPNVLLVICRKCC